VRTARGVIASLGAGGSLVAAGACLLLLVSAVVAFEGWPDIAGTAGAPDALVLADPAVAPDGGRRSAPRRPRDVAAPGLPATVPAGAAPPARGSGQRAGVARPARGRPHRPHAPSVSAPTTAATGPAAAAPVERIAPAASTPAPRPRPDRGDGGLGEVATPALPEAPAAPPVPEPGPAVREIGEAAGEAAGGAAQQVLPSVAQGAQEVTEAVGVLLRGSGG
jgi:hypothetical protein